jgi:hypothetical protein
MVIFLCSAHETLHRWASLDRAQPASGGPSGAARICEEPHGQCWSSSRSTLKFMIRGVATRLCTITLDTYTVTHFDEIMLYCHVSWCQIDKCYQLLIIHRPITCGTCSVVKLQYSQMAVCYCIIYPVEWLLTCYVACNSSGLSVVCASGLILWMHGSNEKCMWSAHRQFSG